MTINIDHTAKLLQASIDIIEKDNEIARLNKLVAALQSSLALQDAQISTLQCRLQRSTIPFDKRSPMPALCRPQAG